jgi:hypothetical protein
MVPEMAQIVARSTVFWLITAVLSTGCSKTVVLGSECPDREGPCGLDIKLPPQMDAAFPAANPSNVDSATSDGGQTFADASDPSGFQNDAGAPPTVDTDGAVAVVDASAPPDPDGGPSDASTGLLQNPSFELRENPAFGVSQSQFGTDVFVSDLGGFVPVAGQLFANIDPWFACWLGVQVDWDLSGIEGGLRAKDGEALITASYGPYMFLPGLFQVLQQPLQAGGSYSFRVDALNSGRGRAALWLGASNLPCTTPALRDESEEITNTNRWESFCFTLEPTRSVNTIALIPVSLDSDAGAEGQISFDNIQQVESCP